MTMRARKDRASSHRQSEPAGTEPACRHGASPQRHSELAQTEPACRHRASAHRQSWFLPRIVLIQVSKLRMPLVRASHCDNNSYNLRRNLLMMTMTMTGVG